MDDEINKIFNKTSPKKKTQLAPLVILAVLIICGGLVYYFFFRNSAGQIPNSSNQSLQSNTLPKSPDFPEISTKEDSSINVLPLQIRQLVDPGAKSVSVKKVVFEDGKIGWSVSYFLDADLNKAYNQIYSASAQTWGQNFRATTKDVGIMELYYPLSETNITTNKMRLKAVFTETQSDSSKDSSLSRTLVWLQSLYIK